MRPDRSQTILISNLWQNPRHHENHSRKSEAEIQKMFDDMFEDLFVELSRYGELIELHVCDNVGEHLIGNAYARYEWETEAQAAVDNLNDRWYAGE